MFNVAALAACMRLYVWCVHECAVQPTTTTSASRSVCCDGAWERGGGGGGEVPGFGDELKRGVLRPGMLAKLGGDSKKGQPVQGSMACRRESSTTVR
ncbi:hypothetical protein IWX46DRAFT_114568 [Phyllosticta citricarpa]|uniref:Secreted protein n=1 Tax=Phyllosticta citricarpa TaxID=55181 RepID=A0ABR1MBJ1_9PEZI